MTMTSYVTECTVTCHWIFTYFMFFTSHLRGMVRTATTHLFIHAKNKMLKTNGGKDYLKVGTGS